MPHDPDQPRDERGRWTNKAAGGVIGAALVAGLMAAAGGGDTAASVGAALDAAQSQGAADAETAKSRQAAKQGNEAEAWQRMALKKLRKDVERDLRCVVQSYGQVQQLFLSHPCDQLHQRLFALGDARGDAIVVSIMWVKMPSSGDATQLKDLEDTYGSGDVRPFGSELLDLGGVHFTGKHYASRQDGSLVVIAETEPVRGHPSDQLLKEIATVADVLPPP